MSRRLAFALLGLAFAVAGLLLLFIGDPVDRCLDSGGAWDATAEACRR